MVGVEVVTARMVVMAELCSAEDTLEGGTEYVE